MAKVFIPSLASAEEQAAQATETAFLRVLGYTFGGQGKTTLFTCLADEMYPMVYVASDPTSPALLSVLKEDQDRIVVLAPEGRNNGKTDLYGELRRIVEAEWWQWGHGCGDILGSEALEKLRAKWPQGAKSFVWDTVSSSAYELMIQTSEQVADLPRNTKGTTGEARVIDRTDYGNAQGLMQRLTRRVMKQPLHVLCLSHEGATDPAKGGNAGFMIGPVTVGAGTIRSYSMLFNYVFRIERMVPEKGESWLQLLLHPEQPYVAGVKSATGGVPKNVTLKGAAQRREFWQWLLDLKKGSK